MLRDNVREEGIIAATILFCIYQKSKYFKSQKDLCRICAVYFFSLFIDYFIGNMNSAREQPKNSPPRPKSNLKGKPTQIEKSREIHFCLIRLRGAPNHGLLEKKSSVPRRGRGLLQSRLFRCSSVSWFQVVSKSVSVENSDFRQLVYVSQTSSGKILLKLSTLA